MSAKGSSGGMKPSDYHPSLPDNKAEAQAARDAQRESGISKSYSDSKAKNSADSLMKSILGKNK